MLIKRGLICFVLVVILIGAYVLFFVNAQNLDIKQKLTNGVLYYNDENKKYEIPTKQAISSAEKVALSIGLVPEGKVPIYLKDNSSFEKIYNSNMIGAYYDAKKNNISVLVKEGQIPIDFKNRIAHEYGYFIFISRLKSQNVSASDFPRWFHEGLASYIAKNEEFKKDKINFPFIEFNNLRTAEQFEKQTRRPGDPFIQSQFAIEQIIDAGGKMAVIHIVEKIKQGMNFNKALRETTHLNEQQFKQTIVKRITEYSKSK
ncbi:hypothetical protein LCY76_16510 [Fictibacillus sp. KIGAM418]|uniref:Uncharacterized protein n=1 Tax=Fictibacillus marinisediminis TaxID=2878389 RepID=A0A9X1XIQ2_9BACL|nr:hypothetical protein [Fictibacillus marinisediminis]MCK6258179.1 hypothetical protein [Fictibacillus marinisediminis]